MTPRRRRYAIAVSVYLAALAAIVLWPLTAKESGPLWDVSAWLGYAYSPAREVTADVAINLLAFVPVGVFLPPLVRAGGRPARRVALVVLAAGAGLALGLEGLQWALAWRTPSLLDVAANTAGTALGLGLDRLIGRDS